MKNKIYKMVTTGPNWYLKNIKCQDTCPAHTNVPKYISLIANGRYEDAYFVNKEANLFPSILSRICNHPCESACRRCMVDEPVAICALKRFAADQILMSRIVQTLPKEKKYRSGKTVAIIGAGPVGLTVAHDLALMGHRVTIFESRSVIGGMLYLGIPEYRLPRDIIELEITNIRNLGVEFRTNTMVGRDIGFDEIQKEYDAILIAVGAHKGLSLGIQGEGKYEGFLDCIDFLRGVNLGDRRRPGKKVVIIGGGNSAIDSARTAIRLGTEEVSIDSTDAARTAVRLGSDVTILYRRTKKEMPANFWEIEEAENEGVKIHFLTAPVKILGKEGKLTGLECIKMKLGEPDESGRRRPIPIDGSEFVIECDTIIPAISQIPDLTFLPEEHGLEISEWGSFVVDHDTLQTNKPGIFAAGDAVTGPKTVIEGVAVGHRTALHIDKYLGGDGVLNFKFTDKDKLSSEPLETLEMDKNYDSLKRPVMPTLSSTKRIGSFREVELGFTKEMALDATRRCLKCNYNIIIEANECILCGACIDICPQSCLRMVSVERIEAGGIKELEEDKSWNNAYAMIMDDRLCIRCKLCVNRCPTGAITMQHYEPLEAE